MSTPLLHLEEFTRTTAALRALGKPPFTIQLAAGASAQSFETDGLAGRPSRFEEAKWLLERSMRVRLPSRVLVVDDSATMRSIVRKTLASTRFPLEVSEADEGFTALKLVRDTEFHIVFLDYNMPDFSGLETLAEFKREQRRVNVVMMTSTPSAELAIAPARWARRFSRSRFFPRISKPCCRASTGFARSIQNEFKTCAVTGATGRWRIRRCECAC
jgi:CheY-like chemotaxis protein